MLPTLRGSNLQPPEHQSDAHPIEPSTNSVHPNETAHYAGDSLDPWLATESPVKTDQTDLNIHWAHMQQFVRHSVPQLYFLLKQKVPFEDHSNCHSICPDFL